MDVLANFTLANKTNCIGTRLRGTREHMAGTEISHQGSRQALYFIVARTQADGVEVIAVTTLGSRMHLWIAVDLGRRGRRRMTQECHRRLYRSRTYAL
jgi:hypothetical protein